MKKTILLTSFDTWLDSQQSNAADDLLLELAKMASTPHQLTFLRQLPVDIKPASSLVLAKIRQIQPDYVVCCGMATSRSQLTVEVLARNPEIVMVEDEQSILHTTVNVEQLVNATAGVEISYDCGKFVCEGLYYSVLDYLHQSQLSTPCIFVHVPVLNSENLNGILADFLLILNNLVFL